MRAKVNGKRYRVSLVRKATGRSAWDTCMRLGFDTWNRDGHTSLLIYGGRGDREFELWNDAEIDRAIKLLEHSESEFKAYPIPNDRGERIGWAVAMDRRGAELCVCRWKEYSAGYCYEVRLARKHEDDIVCRWMSSEDVIELLGTKKGGRLLRK